MLPFPFDLKREFLKIQKPVFPVGWAHPSSCPWPGCPPGHVRSLPRAPSPFRSPPGIRSGKSRLPGPPPPTLRAAEPFTGVHCPLALDSLDKTCPEHQESFGKVAEPLPPAGTGIASRCGEQDLASPLPSLLLSRAEVSPCPQQVPPCPEPFPGVSPSLLDRVRPLLPQGGTIAPELGERCQPPGRFCGTSGTGSPEAKPPRPRPPSPLQY